MDLPSGLFEGDRTESEDFLDCVLFQIDYPQESVIPWRPVGDTTTILPSDRDELVRRTPPLLYLGRPALGPFKRIHIRLENEIVSTIVLADLYDSPKPNAERRLRHVAQTNTGTCNTILEALRNMVPVPSSPVPQEGEVFYPGEWCRSIFELGQQLGTPDWFPLSEKAEESDLTHVESTATTQDCDRDLVQDDQEQEQSDQEEEQGFITPEWGKWSPLNVEHLFDEPPSPRWCCNGPPREEDRGIFIPYGVRDPEERSDWSPRCFLWSPLDNDTDGLDDDKDGNGDNQDEQPKT
uniref:Uncharacterized protein n=1 Tax=Spongospora subterranea TaxID=70186 RepID=A0A0H5R3F9_9EUKA|eukprot:CRZ02524.1 hypothetical protein [Spongospora subterranea]